MAELVEVFSRVWRRNPHEIGEAPQLKEIFKRTAAGVSGVYFLVDISLCDVRRVSYK